MEKKRTGSTEKIFHEETELRTKIGVRQGKKACRPGEPVALVLTADTEAEIGVALGLPIDIQAAPREAAIRGGALTVELRAALPGRYTVTVDRLTGGVGKYLIDTGDGWAQIFDGNPHPVAVLDVRWGTAKT